MKMKAETMKLRQAESIKQTKCFNFLSSHFAMRTFCSIAHRCQKNYKRLCFAIVFWLKWAGHPAVIGLNLLAQLSDRIHNFTVYNLMPLAFLTKLSIMRLVLCTKIV